MEETKRKKKIQNNHKRSVAAERPWDWSVKDTERRHQTTQRVWALRKQWSADVFRIPALQKEGVQRERVRRSQSRLFESLLVELVHVHQQV